MSPRTEDLALSIPGPIPWITFGNLHCYKTSTTEGKRFFFQLFLVLSLKQDYFYFFSFSQYWQKILLWVASYLKSFMFSLFPFILFFLETSYLLPSPNAPPREESQLSPWSIYQKSLNHDEGLGLQLPRRGQWGGGEVAGRGHM